MPGVIAFVFITKDSGEFHDSFGSYSRMAQPCLRDIFDNTGVNSDVFDGPIDAYECHCALIWN